MVVQANKVNSILAKEALRWAVLKLQQEKIESASLDSRILLEYVLGVSREQLLFALDQPMSAEQYARFEMLVEKRAQRQPIAQLIGKREFWGMNFVVNEHTLDPRPDSEALVEYVLERVENRADIFKVLDLGTGTGCLLLSILSELPSARGLGVDYSENALQVAKENAMALGLAGRTQFMCGDWCEKIDGEFDIIISNPPYIPTQVIPTLDPEVSQFEPKLALDGGEDGFACYRKIMKKLPKILAKNGFAAFELGMGQQKELTALAGENGLEAVGVRNDLSGIARCIIFQHKN
jgi:release factor glutamine methyltransferase